MNTASFYLLMILLVSGCSERTASLSSQDRFAITNLIEKESIGGITEIQSMRDGTVQVFTHVPGKDGGNLLTLAKREKEWKIIMRGAWME